MTEPEMLLLEEDFAGLNKLKFFPSLNGNGKPHRPPKFGIFDISKYALEQHLNGGMLPVGCQCSRSFYYLLPMAETRALQEGCAHGNLLIKHPYDKMFSDYIDKIQLYREKIIQANYQYIRDIQEELATGIPFFLAKMKHRLDTNESNYAMEWNSIILVALQLKAMFGKKTISSAFSAVLSKNNSSLYEYLSSSYITSMSQMFFLFETCGTDGKATDQILSDCIKILKEHENKNGAKKHSEKRLIRRINVEFENALHSAYGDDKFENHNPLFICRRAGVYSGIAFAAFEEHILNANPQRANCLAKAVTKNLCESKNKHDWLPEEGQLFFDDRINQWQTWENKIGILSRRHNYIGTRFYDNDDTVEREKNQHAPNSDTTSCFLIRRSL